MAADGKEGQWGREEGRIGGRRDGKGGERRKGGREKRESGGRKGCTMAVGGMDAPGLDQVCVSGSSSWEQRASMCVLLTGGSLLKTCLSLLLNQKQR